MSSEEKKKIKLNKIEWNNEIKNFASNYSEEYFSRWKPIGRQLRGPELEQLQFGEQSISRREEFADAVVRSGKHDGFSRRQQRFHLRLSEVRDRFAELVALPQIKKSTENV